MDYSINIRETLEKQVRIESNDANEALRLAEKNWKDACYILDSACFTGVQFSAVEAEKKQSSERKVI